MNIVILAAGMGKRMRSQLPKVLQPIAQKPMIDHVLDKARAIEGEHRSGGTCSRRCEKSS